jgi:hypothetical protein
VVEGIIRNHHRQKRPAERGKVKFSIDSDHRNFEHQTAKKQAEFLGTEYSQVRSVQAATLKKQNILGA